MIKAPKPFQYKPLKHKTTIERTNRITGEREEEVLTGEVRGQPATDIEERFARGLDKTGESYEFQPTMVGARNVQGEIRPDFVIYADTPLIVNVDGEFAHKTAEQKASDEVKDQLLYEALKDYGFLPPIRVPGDLLETPEEAESVAKTVVTEGRL